MRRAFRRSMSFSALALVTAFAAGCEDGINDVEPGLVGRFDATQAVFTDAADANTTLDVMADGGTMDIDFRNDGTFASTLALPGRTDLVTNGTFTTEGEQILFTTGGVTTNTDFTNGGGQLTLDGPALADIDFGGDAGPVPARLNARLRVR